MKSSRLVDRNPRVLPAPADRHLAAHLLQAFHDRPSVFRPECSDLTARQLKFSVTRPWNGPQYFRIVCGIVGTPGPKSASRDARYAYMVADAVLSCLQIGTSVRTTTRSRTQRLNQAPQGAGRQSLPVRSAREQKVAISPPGKPSFGDSASSALVVRPAF